MKSIENNANTSQNDGEKDDKLETMDMDWKMFTGNKFAPLQLLCSDRNLEINKSPPPDHSIYPTSS